MKNYLILGSVLLLAQACKVDDSLTIAESVDARRAEVLRIEQALLGKAVEKTISYHNDNDSAGSTWHTLEVPTIEKGEMTFTFGKNPDELMIDMWKRYEKKWEREKPLADLQRADRRMKESIVADSTMSKEIYTYLFVGPESINLTPKNRVNATRYGIDRSNQEEINFISDRESISDNEDITYIIKNNGDTVLANERQTQFMFKPGAITSIIDLEGEYVVEETIYYPDTDFSQNNIFSAHVGADGDLAVEGDDVKLSFRKVKGYNVWLLTSSNARDPRSGIGFKVSKEEDGTIVFTTTLEKRKQNTPIFKPAGQESYLAEVIITYILTKEADTTTEE